MANNLPIAILIHGETASTSVMGSLLRKHIPKYNIRRYQCKTLLILYERLGKYEIIEVQEGKSIKKIIRLKK